jgi:aspartate carbamoyltransferase regulatory subunit
MAFGRRDELLRHVTIVHMGDKTKYTPKKSKPKISTIENGQLLEQTHVTLLPNPGFPCPHCPFVSERSDKLKIHMASVHSDARPFLCNFCDKCFKLKDKLNLHVNTVHLKKKPFECQYCGQSFGRRDAMKRHQTKWCSMRPKSCPPDLDDEAPDRKNGINLIPS